MFLREENKLNKNNKDNLVEITEVSDKQKLLIVLLKNFHEICEKNNLVYNIFCGTMLGAVRNKGIIPWDDDIDVTMPREDYNKFLSIVKEQYSGEYNLHEPSNKNYIYPYAKFGMKKTYAYETIVKPRYNKLSLNMDIFPNDGYPDNEELLTDYNKIESKIILSTYKQKIPKNPLKACKFFIRYLLTKRYSVKHYVNQQIKMITQKKIQDSEYIICQGAGLGVKGKLKKSDYYDRCLYDFNNIKVWGIRNYDGQLKNLYGDYMTPPPIDKQVPPHGSKLFVDKSIYDKYLKETK